MVFIAIELLWFINHFNIFTNSYLIYLLPLLRRAIFKSISKCNISPIQNNMIISPDYSSIALANCIRCHECQDTHYQPRNRMPLLNKYAAKSVFFSEDVYEFFKIRRNSTPNSALIAEPPKNGGLPITISNPFFSPLCRKRICGNSNGQ